MPKRKARQSAEQQTSKAEKGVVTSAGQQSVEPETGVETSDGQQTSKVGTSGEVTAGLRDAPSGVSRAFHLLAERLGVSELPRTLFFVGWYAIGLLLMVFAEVPRSLEFANGVFLVLYALSLSELAAIRTGWKRLLMPVLLISIGTFAVEWVGTHTGFPFGAYTYSDTLGALVSGVPWTMGLAWVGVIISGALISASGNRWLRALETGVWVLLLDLVLDPVAAARGFWDWADGGPYYGIPTANFVSWFIVGALLSLLLPVVEVQPRQRWLALRLFQLMLLLFGLLALKAGLGAAFRLSLLFIFIAEGRVRLDSRRQKPAI
ncbi:carotenoid biosynthesis protein [Paenibacillus herberti]